MNKNHNKYKSFALFLSLLFHGSVLFIFINNKVDYEMTKTPEQKIELTIKKEKKNKKTDKEDKKQIVENNYEENDVPIEESDLLSKKDQSYKEESLARGKQEYSKSKDHGDSSKTRKSRKKVQKSPPKVTKEEDKGDQSHRSDKLVDKQKPALKKQKHIKLADLSLQDNVNHKDFLQGGELDSEFKKAGTTDYIKDVKKGSETRLNTNEYKYYGFFNRIRRKVETIWNRDLRKILGRELAERISNENDNEIITFLEIIISDEGEIKEIHLIESCGYPELDEVAIKTFELSAPFPNPPKELFIDGLASIEWGFVIDNL